MLIHVLWIKLLEKPISFSPSITGASLLSFSLSSQVI
ncbi:hypothetical protein ERO13_D06G014501v2 [Gossypium hirsutum]|nr:hypothetical protein ERO13_D06G014501v2 [Gossypium hirsutum]